MDFEGVLREAIGLDVASVGRRSVERAVDERVRASGASDSGAYWRRVHNCDAEMQALIESVVVPETWFFRERRAFAMLTRFARQRLQTNDAGVLRILSLPCSTGEEPYSIAMALLDAGILAGRFVVEAVDVSARALAQARRGVYGRNSFRASDLAFRARHFTPAAAGSVVTDQVRAHVRFRRGNLLAIEPLKLGVFDVVFCRNLLIYFDRAMQQRAGVALASLLAPDGLLVVAAAEAGAPLGANLEPAGRGEVGLFRRAAAPPGIEVGAAPPPVAPVAVPLPRRSKGPVARTGSAAVPASVSRKPASDADEALEEARRLGDGGRAAEAALACERHLREHGSSAAVFHLLGLLRDAAGQPVEAEAYYRKALYLDPRHEASLIHLALLLEGDNRTEAERLRSRARRAAAEVGA